jgi:hypothetical protein
MFVTMVKALADQDLHRKAAARLADKSRGRGGL